MSKKSGLPWLDSRTQKQKESDNYFQKLEQVVGEVDSIESSTPFLTMLSFFGYGCAYVYVGKRIRELFRYLEYEYEGDDKDELSESLDEVNDAYEDLEGDAILYDDYTGDDDDDDDDDFDDDDYDDDDLDDDFDDDDDGSGDDDDDDWGW